MQIIEQLFQRHRDKTTLGLLVILSLILLIIPQRAKFGMAKVALNGLFLPVDRVTHFVEDFREMREENRRLKRIAASLLLERERLAQFREERERLRRLADFKEEQFLKLVPCEVIGRNLDRYQTMLVIDKGARDSLRVRMPVLSYRGYVGRIIEVFGNSSWVQLICSRNNPVSCIDKRSRVVGILEWMHHSYFELKNVGIVEDVAIGDTLITSGFGGVVPKGFPVAVVSKVTHAIDGLSLRVEAKSYIKFRSLEEVFVVIDEIPWNQAIFYDMEDSLSVFGSARKNALYAR
ncbi:MAG: rod shape-determining protein MreC [Candidatus Latescibacteria bacterium]|nr:rod shape-determining protein MreC [Candidatus Latescibacterota bacterium]NIO27286.1 rod shape-determining protein MreC [Candidatus Latescibacterota bacterium]NIO54810.1 rod shape-determining protein MreC [Candidatus Latescibacterota bacterium]NIT00893.1 rod shape-determining protein MreC [Candidatus Latescibacterota bacterium]NIT37816.1 rod shape-determining protein MreC [Candidatus Latescibacterota bacterium]